MIYYAWKVVISVAWTDRYHYFRDLALNCLRLNTRAFDGELRLIETNAADPDLFARLFPAQMRERGLARKSLSSATPVLHTMFAGMIWVTQAEYEGEHPNHRHPAAILLPEPFFRLLQKSVRHDAGTVWGENARRRRINGTVTGERVSARPGFYFAEEIT